MTDSLIEDRQVQGPQSHVLLIGVGHYPHFRDGDAPSGADDYGMKQLTSPVHSAREMADWFIQHYQHPTAPLGTVRLLVSEKGNDHYDHPASGRSVCARADFNHVRDAIRAWKLAGDEHVDNVLIFYFSGHGVADGARTVLILDDYGEDDQAPLDGALDFSQVHRAMAHCQARTQCYFIDACRVAGEDLIDGANVGKGTVIKNDPDASIGLPPVRAPIFYSTVSGAEAFGREGQMSVFTEAVIVGLNGAASDDVSGTWRVDCSQMLRLIRHYLQRAEERGESLEQINASENMVDFELNIPPEDFRVPVVIGCQNKDDNEEMVLHWQGHGRSDARLTPVKEHWDVLLDREEYEFKAVPANGGTVKIERRTVRPPYRVVLFQ